MILSNTTISEGAMVKLELEEKAQKWFSIGVDAPNSSKNKLR